MDIARTVRPFVLLCGVALSGTLAAAAPSPADEPAVLEPTTDAKKAAYTKQVVCKKEPVIGTRITKTVCLTPAQREADAAASQKFLQGVQEAATIQTKTMH